MISFGQPLLLLSLIIAPCVAFSPSNHLAKRRKTTTTSTVIYYSEDSLDHADAAEPLRLTEEDLRLLTELKSRQVTMPILLLDCLLPGQNLEFMRYDVGLLSNLDFFFSRG